ncbi:MAG: peptidoglycan DD-metalloendopeptidase family protein [Clostridiales bacterium]|nr:peptidoglycan DD-metalloendopeptidase family protein [Clostridiales bacterium]
MKAEKTKSLVREKTSISDVVIKDKSVNKADGIKTAKDGKFQKDNNKAKTKAAKQGIIKYGAEVVKNTAVSEITGSDDEGLQLVGKAAVAGRILVDGYYPLVTGEKSKSAKIPSKTVSKTTKGTFRRSRTDKAGDSPLKKAFVASVIPTGRELMNGTAARAGTIGKNTLKEGKYALKNTVVKAVSENADNSLAIAGVDMGIKAADTVATAVRGTKAAVNTGKSAVKTAASTQKNVYNGAKKLKELSNRLYKFARMKRTQKIQAVGKGVANIGKVTLTAAVNMISAVVSAVAGFFMPLLLIALIIFAVIATIISLIPIISLKADDAYLTEVWEYISEKDADLEIKYKDTYYNYPSNYQHFGNIIVNKYFSVNGSEIISEEDQRYTFRRYVNVFDFTDEEFRPVSSDTRIYNTSYKSNIDAFLAYLDAKYEDYEFSEVKSEIDNLYEQIVRVQYVDNEDEPSWKMIHEIQYRVFNMNVNLHYTDTDTYIQNNYDTLFTDKEKETYEVLDEVGQYLTRIELGCPIETTDDSIACQKRYGYYVESDADAKTAVKKFYKGIDITAEPGTNVLSPLGGQISSVNGNEIEIYSSSGKKYITLSNVTGITVSEGDTVRKGDVLGQTDSSGYICITYRIKKLGTDTYLNPAFYIDNIVYVNNANTAVMYDTSAIDLSQYTISTELTGTAAAVVRAALAMVGASGYSGMCATVASKIYQEAGLGYHGGNGNEFSRANKLSVSSGHVDYTKIPVGAYIGVKYGTGSAGYTYGHVGIYVGLINGEPTVVEGGGTLVRTTSLDHFYSYYVTNNSNSYYGNDIGWNITSTGGSVSPLYFEGTDSGDSS